METIERKEGVKKIINQLIMKAWEDTIFKEQLISSPETTITDFTGKRFVLSEGKKIIIEDQMDSDIVYLNIPRKMDFNNIELTDDQLEKVNGGSFWLGVVGGLVANALYDMGNGFVDEMMR